MLAACIGHIPIWNKPLALAGAGRRDVLVRLVLRPLAPPREELARGETEGKHYIEHCALGDQPIK